MSLKSIVFRLVNRVSAANSSTLTRSHAYELIAAAFAYQTYAAFSKTAVALFDCDELSDIDYVALRERCQQLRYEATAHLITQALQDLIQEYSIRVVRLIDITRTSNCIMYQCNEEQLVCSLEAQAQKNPLANYALGVILMSLIDAEGAPNAYWYHQLKMGRTLSHDEEVFAMEYQRYQDKLDKAKRCFYAATEHGCALGTLGLALYFKEHQFFDQRVRLHDLPDETYDPMEIAFIAQAMGHNEEYKFWLLTACGRGNIDAIRTIVDEMQEDKLVFCHALVELSALLGSDIRENYHVGVDEHGNEIPDNHHGPIYADGYYGVELPDISESDKSLAKSFAEIWMADIQQTGRAQCIPNLL